jgi:hypothetical protein
VAVRMVATRRSTSTKVQLTQVPRRPVRDDVPRGAGDCQGVDVTARDEIVATCSRGRLRQSIPILDLVLPAPAPAGAEWIEAYRRWTSGA